MTGLLLGILCCIPIYAAGKTGLSFLKISCAPAERKVLAMGLGLGILSYAILGLGFLGLLKPIFFWVLLVLFSLALLWRGGGAGGAISKSSPHDFRRGYPTKVRQQAARFVRTDSAAFWRTFRDDRGLAITALSGSWNFFDFAVFGIGIVCLLLILSGVLLPETANDSLCYHLNLPKRFLQAARIYAPGYEVNAGFPLFMEMLYTLGLGIQGATLAKFFHLLTGILTCAGLAAFASKNKNQRYGLWAGVLFLTTPGILNQLSTTYVDSALACFTFLSLGACLTSFEAEENKPWLILSGIFCAFALGIKFLALISFLGLMAVISLETWRQKDRRGGLLKNLACFALPAILLSAVWYLRSYLIWGNPVYPYFPQIFRTGDPTIQYNDIGLSKNLLSFLMAPWWVTMHPLRFEGFGDQIGPAYLAFSPLVLLAKAQARRLAILLWCSLYFLFWFNLGQSMRFLFPMLPILGLLMAWGFAAAEEGAKISSVALRLMIAAVLVIQTGLAAFHYRREIKFLWQRLPAEEYLKRNERSYELAQWSNSNLPAGSKMLAADETHLFYFDMPIAREVAFSLISGYDKKMQTPGDLLDTLKREGFTHILFAREPVQRNRIPPNRLPAILEHRQNEIAPYVKPLYTTSFTGSATPITYTVYEIL